MRASPDNIPEAGTTESQLGSTEVRTGSLTSPTRAAELLLQAMRELSRARSREAVADVVKRVARALVDADGATFVLRDGDKCYYLDEDAISPLWKGQRFPAETCVSGWVMNHAEQVVMEDIYTDSRVPHAAYRPTFVKSLVMTPVRREDPIAAIGIYWGHTHRATAHELALLQDLADTTAVALESAEIYGELERRVALRTEQLTQVNRELESFSYSVAHDLRSPLSAILGFAELIEDRLPANVDKNIGVFASEIAIASKRMNSLIGALLDFSRFARAKMEKTEQDLSAQALAIAERLKTQRGSHAVISIERGMTARADANLLEIVLTNLLGNALKYSSKKAAPKVQVGQLTEGGEDVVFYVRDNGAGFDMKHADQLFVPFQRLHTQREFDGTGVGLATVARIVRRHGGHIWAEGVPGEGATFFFTLPDHD